MRTNENVVFLRQDEFFDSHIILSSKVFIANLVFTISQLFQSQQAPYVHGIRKRFTGLIAARNKLGYTGI